jgi:hypothetical protein
MSQQNPNQPQDKQPQLKLSNVENYRDGSLERARPQSGAV